MIFYLGTHRPSWLARTTVPLFVSRRTLGAIRRPPRALCRWAMDSGGFTELSLYGGWKTSVREYLDSVTRAKELIGNLQWAAPMDWMCEPWIIEKTGLSVAVHQQHTVDNFLSLRSARPDLPIVPVIQGWTPDDYRRCVALYAAAGVDLAAEPTVGLGSVCRRQGTAEAVSIVLTVRAAVPGIRLHGFGFKSEGMALAHSQLESADSLAWSYDARRAPPLPGCDHKSCANCMIYAMKWRDNLLRPGRMRAFQPPLDFTCN